MIADNGTRNNVDNESDVQVQSWLAEYDRPDVFLSDLLCDRHADDPKRIALLYEDATGEKRTYTFADLRDLSARFAGVLAKLGVAPGDRVATLLPKSPELLIATLALWRLGAIDVPLFTGPLTLGCAKPLRNAST